MCDLLPHSDWAFLLRVFTNIQQDFYQPKFRKLRRAAVPSEAAVEYLKTAGFQESTGTLQLPVEVKLPDQWDTQVAQVQRMFDLTTDPESITFAQVAAILKRDGVLPGIQEFDDQPIADYSQGPSLDPLVKPWEQHAL